MKQNKQVHILGLTGGVGSGKTVISQMISKYCQSYVINTDRLSEDQMKRGGSTFLPVKEQFGDLFLNEEGEINRRKLGEYIFCHPEELIKLNAITHPAVNKEVKSRIKAIRQGILEPNCQIIVIESAILIEAGYKDICDEIWYVYATKKIRKERLISERGYSQERILNIMKRQGSEKFYRSNADIVINSNKSINEINKQIQRLLYKRKLIN